MNISRKDIDANNVVVTITIDKEDYTEKVDKKLREYRKKANMPGFRPGNVPIGMIKKMYGSSVKADEINNVVSENLVQFIDDNKIQILGQPLPNLEKQNEFDIESDGPFDFAFDVAVAPTFDVEVDPKMAIPYYNIAVSDEMIQNQIQSLTSRFGKYETFDTVEEKDMVKGTLVEWENGKVKEGGIVVENGVLTPSYMKDEKQKNLFVGKEKGAKVVFNPKKAFENETEISSLLKISKEEVANLNADFEMTIDTVTRYIESEINQELFDKVYGENTVTSEEAFRAKIVEGIEETLVNDSEYRFNIDARKAFVDKYSDLTFPEEFLKRWLLETNKELTKEKIDEDFPKMKEDLIWQLIKDKLAIANDIKVENADIEAHAIKVAKSQFAQYGMVGLGDDMLMGYVNDLLKQEETVRSFVDRVVEEKVVSAIREKVKLDKKEISIDDFNKLFEIETA